MRVSWSWGAQEDAQDIVAAAIARAPVTARRLAEELALAAERLVAFPQLGAVVDTDGRRGLLVARGKYRIIYRLDGDVIRILGIGRATDRWPASRS